MSVLGEATWFDSGGRTLQGWVHRPEDGRSIGSLVIVGGFSYERMVTYRALRTLAITAARRGWVAIRYNGTGIGDSEPLTPHADVVATWQEDLAAAVALARRVSGGELVDAVGLRIGAAILASESAAPIRARLLWEPVGGRTFLRHQAALLRMEMPTGFRFAPQGIELCGYRLEPEQADSIRRLPDPGSLAPAMLPAGGQLVLEADRTVAARLYDTHPSLSRVPLESLPSLLDRLDPNPAIDLPPWRPETVSTITDPESGSSIRRTLVEIGPGRLPGVLTEPAGAVMTFRAVLLVQGGTETKDSLALYERAARRLAAHGVPSLRADPVDVGDAADPAQPTEPFTLTDPEVAAISSMATWLHERIAAPVTAIGACAGAWLIARAAAVTPSITRLIMVNNVTWRTSTARLLQMHRSLNDRLIADLSGDGDPPEPTTAGSIAHRIKRAIRTHAPYSIRRHLFTRLGIDEIAEDLLADIPAETSVLLQFGSDEDRAIFDLARGSRGRDRLVRSGRDVAVEYEPRSDHSLMSQAAADAYVELLDREFGLISSRRSESDSLV